MICKLCQAKEANQTGSHIFTLKLVSVCTNVEGDSVRDKELMFGISQSGKTDLYIGRAVKPDKIKEVKGRDLTDDEIENNINRIVRDNVFCTDCEKLFGKVESTFSDTLNEIRLRGRLEFKSKLEIRLFFFIQAWRASICSYNGWKLTEKFEELLRILIFEGCKQFDQGISQDIIEKILSIPIIVTYLETQSGCETTNVILIPDNKKPFLLFLCDLCLQLFEPENEINDIIIPEYFNLNSLPTHKPINFHETQFIFGFMSNVERMYLIRKINSDVMAEKALNGFIETFISYCANFGVTPNGKMISDFVQAFVFASDIPIAVRYTDERIKLLAQKLTGN